MKLRGYFAIFVMYYPSVDEPRLILKVATLESVFRRPPRRLRHVEIYFGLNLEEAPVFIREHLQ